MSDSKRSTAPGKLKIFLGFAPGVGKTFAMIDEARRRRKRGQDIVVGYVNTRGREATHEEIGDLEVIPPSNGELDVKALLTRKPDAALIDDLAHTNAPGSLREKRWQDVEELLNAGINVLSTVNVGNLESLNDHIADITGVQEKETVPDQMLHSAEEVELVDLTPRALINRLERGDVYPKDQISDEVRSFYREGNLAALREMAMREVAHHVDEDVVEYRREKKIEKPWATTDRVMICVSPTITSLRLIRRGYRVGQKLHGEVVAVHVEEGHLSDKDAKILKNDFALAERLGIKTVTLKGDVAEELIQYAKGNNITQIIVGHPERNRIQEMLKGSIINDLIRALKTVDIMVIASESEQVPAEH